MNERQGISIAVLSENQDDVENLNGTLRDAGHAAHCYWIASPEQFSNALESGNIELVLINSDGYPDTVRQAIKQKDAYIPEVPVIVFAESVDEDCIQAAMQDGACDLVSLEKKQRLQSVVTREVRAFRVERALNATLSSATEYRKRLNDYMQRSTFATALVQDKSRQLAKSRSRAYVLQ